MKSWIRKSRRFCLAAFLSLAAFESAPNQAQPAQASPDNSGAVLQQQAEIDSLTGRIRSEYLAGNLETAQALCKRALQLDPGNNTAQLYLGWVERQMKGTSGESTGSAVSAMPKVPYMDAAVELSRPTTPAVVMTLPAGGRSAEPTRPAPRPSVVGGTQSDGATPFWLKPGFLKWAALSLVGLIGALVLLMVGDRFLAGKRQRTAQSRFFDHMNAASQEKEVLAGDVPEVPALDEDFPVGVSVPGEAPETTEKTPPATDQMTEVPVAPVSPEGETDDTGYWDLSDSRGGAIEEAPTPIAAGEEEESKAIAASDAFVGEEPIFDFGGSASAEEAGAEEDEEEAIFDFTEPKSKAVPEHMGEQAAESEPGVSERDSEHEYDFEFGEAEEELDEDEPGQSEVPFLAETEEPDDEEPISLEGFDFQTPSADMTEIDEEGEKRELRAEQELTEDVAVSGESAVASSPLPDDEDFDEGPFSISLGTPHEETKTMAESDLPTPAPDASEDFDEIDPVSFDSKRSQTPPGAEDPDTDSLFADTVVLAPQDKAIGRNHSEETPEPARVDFSFEDPEASYDEILISGSENAGSDRSHRASQPDEAAESTMVDRTSRHKAVFQDQLARGLEAMEQGDWKGAVKFLAIAHAMSPGNDYASKKLREARDGLAKARR